MDKTTLAQIKNGTFCDNFPYSNIDSREAFISAFETCREPEWTIEQKYDGWYSVLCEDGLYSKTGRLIDAGLKCDAGKWYACEYLHGTQWALNHKDHGKLVVHWSNQEYGSPFDSNLGYWVPRISHDEIINNFDKYVDSFEGLVLKNTKTGAFYRYKKSFTADYVITGIEQSDSEAYTGKGIKGFTVGLCIGGTISNIGSIGNGIPYNTRVDAFKNPDKYIGMVVECSGKAVFKSGALRHPAIVRFRTDKPASACTMKQFAVMQEKPAINGLF